MSTHCVLCTSPICCSLCTPKHPLFSLLPPVDTRLDKISAPRASQVDRDYKMDASDFAFHSAVNTFWREATHKKYGLAHLNNLGPGEIMGNDVLKHIMDCV